MIILVDDYKFTKGVNWKSQIAGHIIIDGGLTKLNSHKVNTDHIVRERLVKARYSTYVMSKKPSKFLWVIPYMKECVVETRHNVNYYLTELSSGAEIITITSIIGNLNNTNKV